MTVDYRTFLRRVKVFGLQGQVGYERRLPGKDRIDRAQVRIRMLLGKGRLNIRPPHAVDYEAHRLVLVVECQLTFIDGSAISVYAGIVPSVVQTTGKRHVVVERIVGADAGMSQRFA